MNDDFVWLIFFFHLLQNFVGLFLSVFNRVFFAFPNPVIKLSANLEKVPHNLLESLIGPLCVTLEVVVCQCLLGSADHYVFDEKR